MAAMAVWSIASLMVGCGTTRSTDTTRTATEQLLISDAIDRAVQTVNLHTLAGQTVFLDDTRLGDVVDRNYLISTLRQHLLANGCQLRDKREDAAFVVEARVGAVGTDRNDLLFGVPSITVPQIFPVQPVPGAAIPEIPIAKRRDQRGIAKLAVFAYHRETGTPVWQSGLVHQESSANDVWILGAGPFQRGTIYDGTAFAGKSLGEEQLKDGLTHRERPHVDLGRERKFTSPAQLLIAAPAPVALPAVAQAAHQESQAASDAATAPPSTPAEPAPGPAAVPAPANGQAMAAVPPAAPTGTPPPSPAASVYEPAESAKLPQPRFTSR
jgi:hypothetical protein